MAIGIVLGSVLGLFFGFTGWLAFDLTALQAVMVYMLTPLLLSASMMILQNSARGDDDDDVARTVSSLAGNNQ